MSESRRCPRCRADITEQLDASYEHGFEQGIEKARNAEMAREFPDAPDPEPPSSEAGARPCPTCEGTGKGDVHFPDVQAPCADCGGTGEDGRFAGKSEATR